MIEILTSINKKNHVKLGDYHFSPLMELSAGLVLNYCDELNLDKCKKVPLTLCFPQKKGAALWTSIISLTNAFLSDYIKNVVEGIKYIDGDKVLIHGCVCRISRISKEQIVLDYKDQSVTIQARENFSINQLLTKMSKVPSSRSLNKRSKYIAGLKLAKVNRNSISKILIPNDPEIINQNNLDSKVLLIAGRGNVKSFHDLLNNTVLYEEKLSKTFGLDKNLIIKPDLKPYINFFKHEIKLKHEEFKKALIKFSEIDNGPIVNERVSSFLQRLEHEDLLSQDFEDDFLLFIEEYEREFEQLKFIAAKFPGVQETLPKKLKAVVINDIAQLNEYPETIKGFLAQNIPVVVVSNRNVSNISEIEFYDALFNANPEYYRINWNRKKIQGLIECDSEIDFIDEELWQQSKRYATQQINIKVSLGCELDEMIGQLLNEIKKLDEFERLQKAFYKYFYPALYALKNSNQKTTEVTNLISEFKSVLDNVKGSGLPESTITLFESGIRIAYDFKLNSKVYDPKDNIFSNNLPSLNLKSLYIPSDTNKKNLPTSKKSNLIFSGFPYQEYSGKYLLNSVCVDFITDIEILCWPNEGSLTSKYLKRRLEAGYFSDNIDEIHNFPSKYLLKDKTDYITEIDSFMIADSAFVNEDNQEADLTYLHTFKYKGYSCSDNGESVFKVNCNILNFTDGTFMFLPKNSKILAETEATAETIKVNNIKFTQLASGLRIFKYKKDRSLYKEISLKNDEINEDYNRLEIWREKLGDISVLCNGNLRKIKDILTEAQVKMGITEAKPTMSNIRNWLFDEDMIMPDQGNVKLIISAANDSVIDLDNLDSLQNSYRRVKDHRIHLGHQIKKIITKHLVKSNEILEGKIEINLGGILISVDVKTIESLDQSDYEIEYQHTRKILLC